MVNRYIKGMRSIIMFPLSRATITGAEANKMIKIQQAPILSTLPDLYAIIEGNVKAINNVVKYRIKER